MSKQEARKVTVIEELSAGRFINKQAAELLDLSVRQVQRIKAEASTNGVMSILHKNRGIKSANALDPEGKYHLLKQQENMTLQQRTLNAGRNASSNEGRSEQVLIRLRS